MPVYAHVIDHPDARVLVDAGMTELHLSRPRHRDPWPPRSAPDDFRPRLRYYG
jgi:hypothetical protein